MSERYITWHESSDLMKGSNCRRCGRAHDLARCRVLNHAEALELAQAKQETSNLARCYLALNDEIKRLQEKLTHVAAWKPVILDSPESKLDGATS